MKKRSLLIIGLCLAAFAVSGCDGSKEKASIAESTAEESSEKAVLSASSEKESGESKSEASKESSSESSESGSRAASVSSGSVKKAEASASSEPKPAEKAEETGNGDAAAPRKAEETRNVRKPRESSGEGHDAGKAPVKKEEQKKEEKKEVVYTTKNEVRTEKVPFQSLKVDDPEMPVGETKVSQKGKDGERRITTKVTYADGAEVGREVVSEELVSEPVDEIVLVGAAEAQKKHYYAVQIGPDQYFFSDWDEGMAWAEGIRNSTHGKDGLDPNNLMNKNGYSGYAGGTYFYDGVEGIEITWYR